MQRVLALLTLTAISVVGWSAVRQHRLRQASSDAAAQRLQTWEGEGGGLPDGGPGQRVESASSGGDAAVYADAAERDASA